MGKGLTYADLQSGDVLVTDDSVCELVLVIECSCKANRFAWVALYGFRAGTRMDPNLGKSDLWGEKLKRSYHTIYRGGETIKL